VAQHPGLARGIGDVIVLDRIGRLDIDQGPAGAVSLQHIRGDEDTAGLVGGLEDGRGTGGRGVRSRGEAGGAGIWALDPALWAGLEPWLRGFTPA
jgi:hypothetical protein